MKIVNIDSKNLNEYPATCFMKEDNPGYKIKQEWLKKRFKEGLKIKQLYDDKGKRHGFIEYTKGENAWRSVSAKGYMFIHCIWTYPNAFKKKGYATELIKEVEKEAKGMLGVVVLTSDGPFMSTKEVYLKNKYKLVAEDGKHQLLVKQFKKGPMPKLNDYKKELKKYKGWNIVYSKQCPWVDRFLEELDPKIKKKLNIKIKELKNPAQAQKAPSLYSVCSIIKDGKILADHYISQTRFNNIIKKEK